MRAIEWDDYEIPYDTENEEFDQKPDFFISTHAYKRLKERNGWNKKTSNRMMKKIYEVKKLEESLQKEQKLKEVSNLENVTHVISYGDVLYVFKKNVLVTVLWQNHMDIISNQKKHMSRKRALDYDEVQYCN